MFSGFFERSYSLVWFWTRVQTLLSIFGFLLIPILMNWPKVLLGHLVLGFVILSICALVSIVKILPLLRVYSKATSILSGHRNRDLFKYVRKTSSLLKLIMLMEIVWFIVWPITLILKLMVDRYIYQIRYFIGAVQIKDD